MPRWRTLGTGLIGLALIGLTIGVAIRCASDPPADAPTVQPDVDPAGTVLRGRVMDTDGLPLPGAVVVLTTTAASFFVPHWPREGLVSSDDGSFGPSTALPASRYYFSVEGHELADRRQASRVLDAATPELDLDLVVLAAAQQPRISGRVIDSRGQGLAGASLELGTGESTFEWVNLGDHGAFDVGVDRLQFGDGPFELTISEPRHLTLRLEGIAANTRDLHITLNRALRLEVRVRDHRTGAPLLDYEICASLDGSGWFATALEAFEFGIDDEGSAHAAVREQGPWLLFVVPKDTSLTPAAFVPAAIGSTVPVVTTIELAPRVPRGVQVTDDRDDPVAGATVELIDCDGEELWPNAEPRFDFEAPFTIRRSSGFGLDRTTTDTEGRCEVGGDARRALTLRVAHAGFTPKILEGIDLSADDPIRVVLERSAILIGRLGPPDVLAEILSSTQGFRIVASRPAYALWYRAPDDGDIAIDSQGTFRVEDLASGPWRFDCSFGDQRIRLGAFDFAAGETVERAFDLSAWRIASFDASVLLDGRPIPVTRCTIAGVHAADGHGVHARSVSFHCLNRDGRVRGSTAAGTIGFRVEIPADLGEPCTITSPPFAVAAGVNPPLEVRLHQVAVRLRVLAPDGEPARGVMMQLEGPIFGAVTGTTDGAGHATIYTGVAGHYTVRARIKSLLDRRDYIGFCRERDFIDIDVAEVEVGSVEIAPDASEAELEIRLPESWNR